MDEGFLRLSRKFFSNEMWKVARKFSECEAWLDLIQSARFEATDKAYSELIGGREISYTRGQYPASVSFLMKRWQWSEKKVRYFLAKLKKRGMITTCNKQGMTVITLCNYDEYNPVKGRQRDVDKGIDNNKEISGLNHALGELRAELRATAEKMAQKIEELGQAKGNNKKKDEEDNNIPPTPPKGVEELEKVISEKDQALNEALARIKDLEEKISQSKPAKPKRPKGLNTNARKAFEEYFRNTFGEEYYWTAKDAGNMSQLLQKLTFSREQKQMPVDDASVLYALQVFLSSVKDGWLLENFSVANLNSKYNEIIAQAKNGNNRKLDTKPDESSAGIKSIVFGKQS